MYINYRASYGKNVYVVFDFYMQVYLYCLENVWKWKYTVFYTYSGVF